jgi:large subunit ribosomal protein L24
MSQLVVRPGRNAARQAKKLKEIRKVKGAIVWHERERKKRQELLQERWESKQANIQRVKWENDNIHAVKKKALVNAKEDWQLGPLRPNRAIGEGAEKYGALTAKQMQKPDIPMHSQRNRNEVRERRNEREPRESSRLDLDPPLIVDDKKYFHIEKDDRVVVIAGREKNKVGFVQEIVPRTHEVIVKGINLVSVSCIGSTANANISSNTTIPSSSTTPEKTLAQSARTKCPCLCPTCA